MIDARELVCVCVCVKDVCRITQHRTGKEMGDDLSPTNSVKNIIPGL